MNAMPLSSSLSLIRLLAKFGSCIIVIQTVAYSKYTHMALQINMRTIKMKQNVWYNQTPNRWFMTAMALCKLSRSSQIVRMILNQSSRKSCFLGMKFKRLLKMLLWKIHVRHSYLCSFMTSEI